MRFSLRWLFALVTFAAAACLSLIYATGITGKLLCVALFAFLMASVLGTIYATPNRRKVWAGCALLGWSYLATGYLPAIANAPRPWFVTKAVLDELYPRIVRRETVDLPPEAPMMVYPDGTAVRTYNVDHPHPHEFQTAGQMIAAFIWSFVGGFLGGRFRRDE
ncbi:MAG TPA: hypothetical protein VHC22_14835 [Pirellulales bacterium]|nr:hypothetical protein [Pirellulales bacterium]